MKIVISSFGSSGDFNPCLGLGRALRRLGVDVLFLSNPYYEKTITKADLRFFPAGNYFDVFKEIADHPDYLHPRKGPIGVWKLVLRFTPEMYHAMDALIENEKPDLVACHLLEFGGITAVMNRLIPYATIGPGPMSWFHAGPAGHQHYIALPLPIRRLQRHLVNILIKAAFRYSFMPFCRKNNIPQKIDHWPTIFNNACLNLGLWSPLYRAPSNSDPPNSAICGFVRDDHVKNWPDVPESIVDFFTGPEKPVIAALGSTASLHGDTIYKSVIDTCLSLDWSCLLVGKNLDKFANPGKSILAVNFAPYGWVFPRASVVIHHGGVNTTAETLYAGVPSLVIPHGYDQFDNAIRTQKLGVSKRLKTSRVTSKAFSSTIESILHDVEMHQSAKAFSEKLKAEPDGADTAAQHIIKTINQ